MPAVEPAGGAEEDDDVVVQVLRQLLPLEVLWCSRVAAKGEGLVWCVGLCLGDDDGCTHVPWLLAAACGLAFDRFDSIRFKRRRRSGHRPPPLRC